MKDKILNNWNWIRVLRLVLGVLILVSGIAELDYLAIIVGAVFTVLPLFNYSTCGTGSCGPVNCETKTEK